MHVDGPRIVEYPERPYVGVRRRVTIPFGDDIAEPMGRLFAELDSQELQSVGPVFFKYTIIQMPALEIEFSIFVARSEGAAGDLVGGVLPAGRYAELRYLGHYDGLMEVNGRLIDWVREQGLRFDVREAEDGDHFAARIEIYTNSPDEEPDPGKWETIVSIKLKD